MTVSETRSPALAGPESPTRRLGFSWREHAAALAIFAGVTLLLFSPLLRGDTFSDVAGRQQHVYPWAGLTVVQARTVTGDSCHEPSSDRRQIQGRRAFHLRRIDGVEMDGWAIEGIGWITEQEVAYVEGGTELVASPGGSGFTSETLAQCSRVAEPAQSTQPPGEAGVVVSAFEPLHYDQDESFYPWQVFMTRALRDGDFPLWNPYNFGGSPFFANGQSGVLYPPRLALTYSVSPTRMHDLLLASHLFLAGVAMFLLLGFVGITFPAAIIGGLAWMLNSFALSWQALEHYTVIEAWLPVGVLLAHATVRRRSWAATFALALVLGLIFVGGNALFAELAIVAIMGYALSLVAVDAVRERHQLVGNLGRLATATALFAGLVAVTLLPTLAVAAASARVSLSYGELGQFALPWSALANVFEPPDFSEREPYNQDLFAGTAVGVLALVGLLRREALARFAAVLGVVTILFMVHTPVTYVVSHILPGFGSFKPLGRAAFLLQFALAVLAAFGLDSLRRRLPAASVRFVTGGRLRTWSFVAAVGTRRWRAQARFLAGALFGVLAGGLTILVGGASLDLDVGLVLALVWPPAAVLAFELGAGQPGRRLVRWTIVTGALFGALSGVAAVIGFSTAGRVLALAAAALVLAFVLAPRQGVLRSRLSRWALSIAVPAVVGWSIVHQELAWADHVMPHQPNRPRYLYPSTPLVKYLVARPEARFLPTGEMFRGSTSMLYPIESGGGYESLLPRRIQNFWRAVGEGLPPRRIHSEPLIYAYHPHFDVRRARPAQLARAAVDFVATPPASIGDKPLPRAYDAVYEGPDGRILSVPDALPRAVVVGGCDYAATSDAALRRFLQPTFDPRRSVILEASSEREACAAAVEGRAGTASVAGRSINEVTVRVNALRSGWLVLAESWDRSWGAKVDGVSVPVLPGNYAFRAVPVEAGRHLVTFSYKPTEVSVGGVISAFSLAIAVLGLGVFVVRGRRAG